jgi:hypothetical protein
VKKATNKSTGFSAWFEAQFGDLPLPPGQRQTINKEIQRLQAALGRLQTQQKEDDEQQARYTAALYVWQIGDDSKKTTEWDEPQAKRIKTAVLTQAYSGKMAKSALGKGFSEIDPERSDMDPEGDLL